MHHASYIYIQQTREFVFDRVVYYQPPPEFSHLDKTTTPRGYPDRYGGGGIPPRMPLEIYWRGEMVRVWGHGFREPRLSEGAKKETPAEGFRHTEPTIPRCRLLWPLEMIGEPPSRIGNARRTRRLKLPVRQWKAMCHYDTWTNLWVICNAHRSCCHGGSFLMRRKCLR